MFLTLAIGVLVAAILISLLSKTQTLSSGTGNKGMMLDVKEWCDFDVVGEASYQDALGKLARVSDSHVAHLRPEPENQFDNNAVAVYIGRDKVGYLPKQEARDYTNQLNSAGIRGFMFACPAYITGGFKKDDGARAHLGVKLGIKEPISIVPLS